MIFTNSDINYFEILFDEVLNELGAVEPDISLSPLPEHSPVPTAKHVQLPITYTTKRVSNYLPQSAAE